MLHMRMITSQDYYSVKIVGYISNVQLDVLELLYKPFIGVVAASLFRTLLLTRNHNDEGLTSHHLLLVQLGLNKDQLSSAFSSLEAVGLITTFERTHPNYIEYIYHLNAPKDPAAFNKDAIFMHLLKSAVGEKNAQDLLMLFKLDYLNNTDKEVSTTFTEVFADQLSTLSHKPSEEILTNNVSQVVTPFDVALFFNLLPRERQILPTSLSQEEVREISQIATMFNLSESGMVAQVGDFYSAKKPFGSKVDMKALIANLQSLSSFPDTLLPFTRRKVVEVKGESEKAKLIKQMETMNPFDFLQLQNHGLKVAYRDQEIISALSLDYHLTNAAINALIYHALITFDNTLPKAAIEKLASSISRRKLVNALDVLDSLSKPTMRKKAKKEETPEVSKEESEMSLDDIMKEINKA